MYVQYDNPHNNMYSFFRSILPKKNLISFIILSLLFNNNFIIKYFKKGKH